MIIAVGSTNPAKVGAVEEAWQEFSRYGTILSASVPSGVSEQPFSDKETIDGAVSRARRAKKALNAAIGVGLEGGVTETPNGLFLCNWGALVDESGKLLLAGGARIPLPDAFRTPLNQGKELGLIMEEYSKQKGVRRDQGAVGIFTNNQVKRKEMFVHVCKLLFGQYQFYKHHS